MKKTFMIIGCAAILALAGFVGLVVPQTPVEAENCCGSSMYAGYVTREAVLEVIEMSDAELMKLLQPQLDRITGLACAEKITERLVPCPPNTATNLRFFGSPDADPEKVYLFKHCERLNDQICGRTGFGDPDWARSTDYYELWSFAHYDDCAECMSMAAKLNAAADEAIARGLISLK